MGLGWRGTARGLVASADDTLIAARTGRQAGFKGGTCMRANQVAALNQGFTPTEAETARAQSVIATYASAQGRGETSGLLHGERIDAPRAAIAADLMTLANACEARERGRAIVVLAHTP